MTNEAAERRYRNFRRATTKFDGADERGLRNHGQENVTGSNCSARKRERSEGQTLQRGGEPVQTCHGDDEKLSARRN